MITIAYSTHRDNSYNQNFKQHIVKSVGLKNVQVLEYENKNQFSLAEIYNKAISESKYDIVVCLHNDVKLENNWGRNLIKDYELNPDYAIIGKAGSCYFPESGIYWERMNHTMVGQVYHHPQGHNKWLSKYSPKFPFLIPVVTIDGLFISFDKNKIKHKFDETIGKFHFYDHSFCVPNYLDGVKIGVTTSFDITHESVGQPNQEFFESKDKFLKKWGTNLPLDLKPINPYHIKIKQKLLKNTGKVAIIIPNKDKNHLLFNCINSFYEHCDSEIFNIFIADTGSSEEQKEELKSFISDKKNVKLIEYDYYNFAKINNDVVKNYIDNEFEFLLFANNDIKILNNVIYGMINVFKTKTKVGTVGARLHFEDNTIQHDGVFIYLDNKNKGINVEHRNYKSYYNFSSNVCDVLANTAALMMIKKSTFNMVNGFNESYVHCFEDLELNLQLKILNYNNYVNSDCVAYHYESQTRNIDENKSETMNDYNKTLLPMLKNNFDKLKKSFLVLQ